MPLLRTTTTTGVLLVVAFSVVADEVDSIGLDTPAWPLRSPTDVRAQPTGRARGAAISHQTKLCQAERSGFYYVGFDQVFVQPVFSRNIAYWSESSDGLMVFHSFDWGSHDTPRVRVGYQSPAGVGICAQYWRFDNSASFYAYEHGDYGLNVEANLADASVSIDVYSNLVGWHSIKLDVFDLEITKRGDFSWGWLAGSGGLRYADLSQRAEWFALNADEEIEFIDLRHGFCGVGPTLRVEGGTPLFGSNVSFFASGRASLMLGQRSASVRGRFAADVMPDFDSLLSVWEGQVGFEWAKPLRGRRLSVRTAIETQLWRQGGGASGGDDEGMPADQIDLGFVGTSVSTTYEF